MKHKAEEIYAHRRILEYLETRASQLRTRACFIESDAEWADSGPARASLLDDAREARAHAVALEAEAHWLRRQEAGVEET